jgi:hypothetical protein
MEKEFIAHMSKSVCESRSPGPAAYHISRKFKNRTPVIRMRSRLPEKTEQLDPAYVNLKPHFGRVAKVHMHVRTDTAQKFIPPGPNYMPPAFGKHGIKVGFAPHSVGTSRAKPEAGDRPGTALGRKTVDDTPGPGPGKYYLRLHEFDENGKRGQSILGHHDFDYDKLHNPGPSTYRPRYEKILPAEPKWGIKGKYKDKQKEGTPGYIAAKSTLTGYKYSMKARATDEIQLI